MRISGLTYYKAVDAAWEAFWQYVSASIGLALTSVAAFRSLFISHRVSHRQQESSDFRYLWLVYKKGKQALQRLLSVESWRTRAWYLRDKDETDGFDTHQGVDLGKIERGTITGLRTFIHQYQRTPATPSQVMCSHTGIEVDDYRETWTPDKVVTRGLARDHKYGKTPSISGSGRHKKILDHKESHRLDKMLAHKESRRQDKMLNSQESRKHDKMLRRQETDEHDKVIATVGIGIEDAIIAIPEKARRGPDYRRHHPVTATSDSDFDGSRSWFRGNSGGKWTPKTKAGMMAKLKCGGIVFSAGFKAERYKEEV